MSILTTSKTIKRIIASLLITQIAFAFEVTHQIRPNSNFETMSLSQSCSTISGTSFSTLCNPALFSLSKVEGITLAVIGKGDGDSIDNGRDLIFDPITEDLIRKLFEEKNFNSFTFNSGIRFSTSLFEITYSPYFLLADLYIFNPAFPEISVNLINRESLRLTSGSEKIVDQLFNRYDIYFGLSAFYYSMERSNAKFSLFDLVNTKPEELIKFDKESGFDGDIGLFFKTDYKYFADLSIQVKNVLDSVEDKSSGEFASQKSRLLFERYTSTGLGKTFKTSYGGINLNLEFFHSGLYEEFYSDLTTLGFRYDLNLFSILSSVSKNYQNLGLLFRSENFNIGLSYARELDAELVQDKSDNSVYVGLEVVL